MPDPMLTEAEVLAAAEMAHCRDFIETMPEGFETMVGDRGVKLSGGQRQRIAIARALLKNAPILLLDEATSALDTESEQAIQHALDRLMSGRTVIAIAHRLSTLQSFDRIIVMDKGRIVDDGSPFVLANRPGPYRELLRKQRMDPVSAEAALDEAAKPGADHEMTGHLEGDDRRIGDRALCVKHRRRLTIRVGMIEHDPGMVMLRVFGEFTHIKPADTARQHDGRCERACRHDIRHSPSGDPLQSDQQRQLPLHRPGQHHCVTQEISASRSAISIARYGSRCRRKADW